MNDVSMSLFLEVNTKKSWFLLIKTNCIPCLSYYRRPWSDSIYLTKKGSVRFKLSS